MATILFDKMRAARRLEGDGNFTRQQAETLSEVLHDSMSEGVATKTDMDALSADLKATEFSLRADLKALESTFRAELNSRTAMLEAKISDAKTQIILWVTGVMLTLLAASGLMQHFLH